MSCQSPGGMGIDTPHDRCYSGGQGVGTTDGFIFDQA